MVQPDLVCGSGTLPGAMSGSGMGLMSSWAADAYIYIHTQEGHGEKPGTLLSTDAAASP